MKKIIGVLILCLFAVITAVGCVPKDWEKKFDTAINLDDSNWQLTLFDDFVATQEFPNGDTQLNPAVWSTSPHGLRRTEYWCDQMVEVRDGKVIIRSEKQSDHDCPQCLDKQGNRVKEGIFTSGIEGRMHVVENGTKKDKMLFAQAFGYFEVSVKVPIGDAMWSAFWLQSSYMGKIGNGGRDGSEIDVYESAFGNKNPTKTGACIHYDGYETYHGSKGYVADTGKNLYDGEFHTYAVKWSPEAYVFYVDGEPVWATNVGGVSRVPEFMRLTVEIRENTYAPYGQKVGEFKNVDDGSQDFVIDYVKVYQNNEYLEYIKADSDFKDHKNLFDGLIVGGIVLAAILLVGGALAVTTAIIRKKKVS